MRPGAYFWVIAGTIAMIGTAAAPAAAQDAGSYDAGPYDSGSSDGGFSPSEVIATYCNDPNLQCTTAPLVYQKTITLPVAFDWDTGWIPSGSPLQLHLFLKIPATTTVDLGGKLKTSWPDPMTLATPGEPKSGLLAFDYGLIMGAQGRIDVSILGVPIQWTGNIPYTPRFNFELQNRTTFDSWAFAPNGVTISAESAQNTLLYVDLLLLAGIPISVTSGGISIDVQGDLSATYTTDRIRIEPASAEDPPILGENDSVSRAFSEGGYVDYDVWPEGTVHYEGTLHVIPSFYLKALGQKVSMPITNLPIPIQPGDQQFVFDPVRVHVPLPDIPPLDQQTIDFGRVPVGSSLSDSIVLKNIGEARARAIGIINSQYADTFTLPRPETVIDPAQQQKVEVDFTPQKTGHFETVLSFVTNDPDTRFQRVTLEGDGVQGDSIPGFFTTTPRTTASANQPGGCGCRLGEPATPEPTPAWALLGVALWAVRRRRRTS